jgi:hypothetical protein
MATQRLLLGQDTARSKLEPRAEASKRWVTFQAAAPPVGLLEVTTPPFVSTATQRPLLGHEMPFSEQGAPLVAVGAQPAGPYTCVTFQAAAPPVGFLEVTTLPPPSTATQKLLLGQDTLERPPDPFT